MQWPGPCIQRGNTSPAVFYLYEECQFLRVFFPFTLRSENHLFWDVRVRNTCFFAFRLVTRRETFLPHPLLFLNLPLMSSYWSTLDDFSKMLLLSLSELFQQKKIQWKDTIEAKVYAKMLEHSKTSIPRKIPIKSSKKTQTVGELISFLPAAGWNILVVAAPGQSSSPGFCF